MLSDKPLPDMTHAEALDTLARLYKTHVDPRVNEGRIRVEIERMEEGADIEAVLCDIGKALQQAERGSGFNLTRAAQKTLIAEAGRDTLEKFYFNPADIDKIIDHTHEFQAVAQNLTTQALIEKAMLEADIKAYRRACTVPAYKAIARPLLDALFGRTGVEAPRVDPAQISMDDEPSPAGV